MNSRIQSSGLTITQASHVFLVEPSLNPALEKQAMGRVHRLGQKQETWVHQYIMLNSIEEEILKMRMQREKSDFFDNCITKRQGITDDAGFDDMVHLLNHELDMAYLANS